MDYEFFTTFWNDFTIADIYGIPAIQDTFNRAFLEWQHDYKYLTELVIVLNHKMWIWHQRDNKEYVKLYQELFEEADAYATENLKGDALSYFLEVTD